MRHDKCVTYTAKETLGYRGRELYVSTARGTVESGKSRSKNMKLKTKDLPRKRREEPMEEQKRKMKRKGKPIDEN